MQHDVLHLRTGTVPASEFATVLALRRVAPRPGHDSDALLRRRVARSEGMRGTQRESRHDRNDIGYGARYVGTRRFP